MLQTAAAVVIGAAATYLACRLLPSRLRIPVPEDRIAPEFHRYFYMQFESTWANAKWLGVRTLKCPLDLWVYQELIHETKPDLIVETGTFDGGSAYFFASLLDLIGRGRVLTVDIEDKPGRPTHQRIEYLRGGSTDPAVVERVKSSIRPGERVMVVLDSDHSRDHVLAEMRAYWDLVTPGCYLVVEDGNIHGNPVPIYDQGDPAAAIETFMSDNDEFIVDRSRERFLVTFFPGGWLRRVEAAASSRPG